MRDLREIRGLKYPDEFVVRHAFKLGARTGHVLEPGCGSGNSLGLQDPAALTCRFDQAGRAPVSNDVIVWGRTA